MCDVLKLKQHKAVRKIKSLCSELFTESGLLYNLDSNISSFSAATERSDGGYARRVIIGTGNIGNTGYFSPVSDEEFARVVLNTYHEKMHCVQKNVLFRQEYPDSDTARQLLQEIACNASNDYYDGCGNYQINVNEIQAEQYGIMSAYNYLRDEFPEIDAKEHERIVLGIVNSKMMDPKADYFVKRVEPFKSLQEVEAAFDDAYDESLTKKRMFLMEREPKDPVKVFMNAHEDAKEMYYKAPTAVEQNRCIAAIALELHPEWLEQYPALKDMDLSYENVIAKPYREIKEREERELHAKEEEMDGIVKGKVNVEPVKVPEKKRYREKDLKGLSRVEQLEMKYGHLMQEENRESEPEK